MVCGATGKSLSMVSAPPDQRLSEVTQQHGRATRSWQTIQSSSHGIRDEDLLSALNSVFQ